MRQILIGLTVFIAVALLTQFLAWQRHRINEELRRQKISQEANVVRDRLKTNLSYSLSATKTLAFFVERYGEPEDFNSIAQTIIGSNKYVDALELTRGGVISHVYPLRGNEAAIGFDVLKDSAINREAYEAIDRKALFFAGPIKLKQGGIAIVGRLPVFVDNKFYGFSAVLIKLSTLTKMIGADVPGKEFTYQLSKINLNTRKEEFFLPGSLPAGDQGFVFVDVPDGAWKLYVIPKEQVVSWNAFMVPLLGFILSIISGFYAWSLAAQPEKLNLLVERKTHELAKVSKELETTLNRISDSVASFDREWRYTFLNDAALATHPNGREGSLGKKLLEVHPLMKGTTFWEAYRKAMETQTVQEREGYYPPMDAWFLAKAYPSQNGLTIFYQDITGRKKAEQEVIQEKNLSASIINSLPGVFYLYNRDGKFVRWNQNFEIISGYSASEIASMKPLQFFHEDEQDIMQEKITEVFTVGRADVRTHFYTKNKERIPYYFNGHLVHFDNVEYLIGMGIDITEQAAVEHALMARTEEIQKLTAHLEQIREEERTRIALEIHDELGQQLTGLKMDASWIGKKLSHEDSSLREKLSSMIFLIDETVKTVRRISSELRPGILDDLGLIPALEWQCQEFEKRTGIKTNFLCDLDEMNPDKDVAINVFRIYQEALTNITRHAQATLVETHLEEKDDHIILTVKDNGIGFNRGEAKTKKSLGLIGMRERALTFHGDLIIDSEMSKGTTLILKVPITKSSTSV